MASRSTLCAIEQFYHHIASELVSDDTLKDQGAFFKLKGYDIQNLQSLRTLLRLVAVAQSYKSTSARVSCQKTGSELS